MNTLELCDTSNIQRVLCIVAHPDDMEYGGSAAVAEWTRQGIEVGYLLLTAGEAGIRDRSPLEVGPLRAAEQREACDIVGVADLEILNHPDGELVASLELRKSIARKIREFRPDTIVTMSWNLEVGWGLNHSDHRATGISVVDAIRDADNPWVFPDLSEFEGLPAWKTRWLYVLMHNPAHAIEVSGESVELAIRSLEAHRDYLAALADHPIPREMITGILTEGGAAADVDYALPIRAYRMG